MIGVLADSGAVRSITSTEPSRTASVRAFSTDMLLLRSRATPVAFTIGGPVR